APPLYADERLGRGPGELHVGHAEEEHVRGRIRHAELPVDRQTSLHRRERDAARGNRLEDVTGEDMLLEGAHDLPEPLVRHVAFTAREVDVARLERLGSHRRRLTDALGQLRDRAGSVPVGVRVARWDVRDEREPLAPMVKYDRAIDDLQADRRPWGISRERMPVEEL